MKPGYHYASRFPGAEPRLRPSMVYLAQMLCTWWGCQIIGRTEAGDYIVSHRPDRDNKPGWYVWWVICDNGGEINVVRINDDESLRSIPYAQNRGMVPIGRLAFWCSEVLRGEERHDFRDDDPNVDDITLDDALVGDEVRPT